MSRAGDLAQNLHKDFIGNSVKFYQNFIRILSSFDTLVHYQSKCIPMSLEQKDIELIEHIVYKNSDDIAVSIARSFERLVDRVDAVESRIYTRIAEVEDKVEASRQDISDMIGEVKEEMREIVRMRDL
jgi:hypothetical protein